MSQDTPDRDEQRQAQSRRDLPARAVFREVLRSRMVWVALVVAVLGGGLWAYGAATRETRPAASAGQSQNGVAGLVQGLQASSPAQLQEALVDDGLAETVGPKLAGGGVSFVGAYGLGWLFRRFLKLAAIVTGLGVAGVAGLSSMGVLSDDDTAKVRERLAQVGESVKDNAGAFKDRALAVLPSSAAGMGGLFLGFRRR